MLLGRRIGARCREQTTILGHGKFKMLQEAEPDARVTVFASACVRIAAHVHACPCTSSWLFRGTESKPNYEARRVSTRPASWQGLC